MYQTVRRTIRLVSGVAQSRFAPLSSAALKGYTTINRNSQHAPRLPPRAYGCPSNPPPALKSGVCARIICSYAACVSAATTTSTSAWSARAATSHIGGAPSSHQLYSTQNMDAGVGGGKSKTGQVSTVA